MIPHKYIFKLNINTLKEGGEATTESVTTAAPESAATTVAASKEATTTAEVIIKYINEINEDGSYTVGEQMFFLVFLHFCASTFFAPYL